MQNSVERVFPELQAHYREAKSQGFPAFVTAIEESTPLNATPYVVSLSKFIESSWSSSRQTLIEALVSALAQLRGGGLRAEVLLVGGSFLDTGKSPRDLDCVIFYSRESDSSIDLGRWQHDQRVLGLDVRLLPIDIDPVMVLKMALFFGVLYTRGKGAQLQLRGLVLVDCSK